MCYLRTSRGSSGPTQSSYGTGTLVVQMERWEVEGFESFRAWRLATEKARRVAKKAEAAEAAAATQEQPPPLPPPPSEPVELEEPPPPSESMELEEPAAVVASMELDAATLAVLNPSTQDDASMASPPPPPPRTLLNPSSSELTPGGGNLVHRLEETTPRGTHSASAEYKAAAVTPEGECEQARARRLATERQRLHRARDSVASSLQQQVEAEQCAMTRVRSSSLCYEEELAAREVPNTYAEYIVWRDAQIEKLTIEQLYRIAEARGKHRELLLTAVSLGETSSHEKRKAERAEMRSSMGLFISLGGESMHQSDGGLRWERFVGLNQQTGSFEYETVRVDDGWGEMSCTESFRRVLMQMNAQIQSCHIQTSSFGAKS